MLQDRRQHLLRGMGQYLVNMATAMENANNTDFRTNLNKMVYEFLETVDQLNQDFESGLWAKRKEDS